MIQRNRIILGVDPGLARLGWGVIDCNGPAPKLLDYGGIQSSARAQHADRLVHIYASLEQVINEYQPSSMAVEEVFTGRNPKSAILAGEGRGACILAGARAGLEVAEYAASVVKVAVTGNGRAAKTQVQAMVCRILSLREPPEPHDAADALAVAITHFQRRKRR